MPATINLRYHIQRNWTHFLVQIAVKKIVRNGKSNSAKRNRKELKKIFASNVSFLKKPPKKPMKKNLKKLHLMPTYTAPTINSIIINTELIMDIINSSNLTTPPTKAVGDQHHPHLNTLLEERSNQCQHIINRLRHTLNNKLN